MLKFILVVIGLTIIISKPFLILVGGAVFLTWLYMRKSNPFALPRHLTTPGGKTKEPEPDLSWEYVDPEEKADREVEKMLRPGFRDDPEWQKFAKNFRDHMNRARAIEDEAMRVEGQNVKNWR